MARARSWAAICVQDFDAPCVLQFAWVNALCCALHRSTSQVIHRSGSYNCVLFTRCIVRALAAIADAKVPTSNCTSRRQQQYLVLVVRVSAERVGRPAAVGPRASERAFVSRHRWRCAPLRSGRLVRLARALAGPRTPTTTRSEAPGRLCGRGSRALDEAAAAAAARAECFKPGLWPGARVLLLRRVRLARLRTRRGTLVVCLLSALMHRVRSLCRCASS